MGTIENKKITGDSLEKVTGGTDYILAGGQTISTDTVKGKKTGTMVCPRCKNPLELSGRSGYKDPEEFIAYHCVMCNNDFCFYVKRNRLLQI